MTVFYASGIGVERGKWLSISVRNMAVSDRQPCPRCASSTGYGEVLCFRCSFRHGRFNRSYVFESLGVQEDKQEHLKVPSETIFEPHLFHIDALRWLYKYGVYKSLIVKHKIGYLPGWHRVFLPVFDDEGNLRFYQLRSLTSEDNIKYLTFGQVNQQWGLTRNSRIRNRRLIIVEDRVSSIRVSEHGNALALHGTSLDNRLVEGLVKDYDEFVMWLDPDRPGLQAKNKVIEQLSTEIQNNAATNYWRQIITMDDKVINTVNQRTIDKDPKCYTDYEIDYILINELREVEL